MQDSLFSRPQPRQEPVEQVQGVTKVVDYIRRIIALNKTLAGIRVRGEVSGLSNKNGRLYFKLKEGSDVLECVVWAGDAPKLPPFKDGDEIICGGDYGTYSPRSQYQLMVKSVELTGAGVLFAQFEALKEKFRKEGLFEKGRKRPMPQFPRRVAVISAQGGRGVEDFFTTIAREAPFVDLIPVPTRVEGDGAEIDIAEAIDKASRMDVDAIVLTRGGGPYESLFPFNREPVVRAIVRAKHPVLSAIGHTGDVLLSDFVADETCETPSNAAHYFGSIGKNFLTRVQRAQTDIERAMQRIYTVRAQRFDEIAGALERAAQNQLRDRERRVHQMVRRLDNQTPQRRLAQRGERIVGLRSRLEVLARHALTKPAQQRALLAARLDASNPRSPLERGYAIVTLEGRAVRDAAAVPQGAIIEAQVQRGKLVARVEGKDLNG